MSLSPLGYLLLSVCGTCIFILQLQYNIYILRLRGQHIRKLVLRWQGSPQALCHLADTKSVGIEILQLWYILRSNKFKNVLLIVSTFLASSQKASIQGKFWPKMYSNKIVKLVLLGYYNTSNPYTYYTVSWVLFPFSMVVFIQVTVKAHGPIAYTSSIFG